MLRNNFSEATSYWYDLLKTDVYTRLTASPELFRKEILARPDSITHVIVDEIQRVPDLLNEIHWLIEQANPPVFVLTGSSARKIKRTHANMLAGRALTYHLHPLTSSELGEKFSLEKVLEFGSLPSAFLEPTTDEAGERLRSYVDTYLKEEIEVEAQLRNLGSYIRFLERAAAENGEQVNFSDISRTAGVSYQTVKGYYQILEDTLMGQMLYPFSGSTRQRLSHHPKFYFFDLGVVRALRRQLKVSLLPQSPEYGRAFEHFVLLEIFRTADYERWDSAFSFYRTAAGAEVDLIIETPKGKMMALEIKATNHIRPRDLRGLRSFGRAFPGARLLCASLEPHSRKHDDILILPWQEVINELKKG